MAIFQLVILVLTYAISQTLLAKIYLLCPCAVPCGGVCCFVRVVVRIAVCVPLLPFLPLYNVSRLKTFLYSISPYTLKNRDGDTVSMNKTTKHFYLYSIVPPIVNIAFGILIISINLQYLSLFYFMLFVAFVSTFIGMVVGMKKGNVMISLTKTGKIEETGNVLKK